MKTDKEHLEAYALYLKLQNFAIPTCKTYLSGLRHFLEFRDHNGIRGPLSQDQAIQFLNFKHDQGKSWSLFNCIYSALRKYFREVLDIEWSVKKLPRPRKDRILPELISKEEVVQLIEHATIYKHQVLITLVYATGLRLSEVLHLKIEHIHGQRKHNLSRLQRDFCTQRQGAQRPVCSYSGLSAAAIEELLCEVSSGSLLVQRY